jgi:predicted nucleic acid-binding protein
MAANRYVAVLDACVLYPAPLRDLLLSLASAGLYQARWTHTIQDEWIGNLLKHRLDLQPEALARTAAVMNEAIEDCLIENFEHLIDTITLPDPDDRHVIAAAIASEADAVVTFNIKDFVRVPEIAVWHPDDFLVSRFSYDETTALQAIRNLRQRLRNPPKTSHQLVATYERQGLPRFSRILQKKIHYI